MGTVLVDYYSRLSRYINLSANWILALQKRMRSFPEYEDEGSENGDREIEMGTRWRECERKMYQSLEVYRMRV